MSIIPNPIVAASSRQFFYDALGHIAAAQLEDSAAPSRNAFFNWWIHRQMHAHCRGLWEKFSAITIFVAKDQARLLRNAYFLNTGGFSLRLD